MNVNTALMLVHSYIVVNHRHHGIYTWFLIETCAIMTMRTQFFFVKLYITHEYYKPSG